MGRNYSTSWFQNASLDELLAERANVQAEMNNTSLDDDYRGKCWDLLRTFDHYIICEREWEAQAYGFPAQEEYGWYLPSDD